MANLLMKFVAESSDKGAVDVLAFPVEDAKEFGVQIEPCKPKTYSVRDS